MKPFDLPLACKRLVCQYLDNNDVADFKPTLWALARLSREWREVALHQLWGTMPLHAYARTANKPDRYHLIHRKYDPYVRKLTFNCFEYHSLNLGASQGKGAQCIPPCIGLNWSNLSHVILALNLIKSWEALCRSFRKHIPNLSHLELLRMDAPYSEVIQYVLRYLPGVSRFRLVQLDQSYEYQLGKCRELERGAANVILAARDRFEHLGIGGHETTHQWISAVCRSQPRLSRLYLGVVWADILDVFDTLEMVPEAVAFRFRLNHFTIEKIYVLIPPPNSMGATANTPTANNNPATAATPHPSTTSPTTASSIATTPISVVAPGGTFRHFRHHNHQGEVVVEIPRSVIVGGKDSSNNGGSNSSSNSNNNNGGDGGPENRTGPVLGSSSSEGQQQSNAADIDMPIPIDSIMFPNLVTLSVRDIQWVTQPPLAQPSRKDEGDEAEAAEADVDDALYSPIGETAHHTSSPSLAITASALSTTPTSSSPPSALPKPYFALSASIHQSSALTPPVLSLFRHPHHHHHNFPPHLLIDHQNIPILRKPFVRMFSRSWDYLKELTLPAISDEDAELIAIHTPVLLSLHISGSDQYRPPFTNRGFLALARNLMFLRHLTVKIHYYDSKDCNALSDGIIVNIVKCPPAPPPPPPPPQSHYPHPAQQPSMGHVPTSVFTRIRWSFTVLRDLDLSYSELSVPAIQALLMECRRLLVLSVRVNTSMYNLPPTVVTASAVPPHVLGADDGDVYLPTNVTGWVVHRQLRNLKIQLSGIHTSITMAAMLSHFPRLEKCRVEVTDQTGWLLEPFLSRFPHIKFSTTKYHSEAWATIPDW